MKSASILSQAASLALAALLIATALDFAIVLLTPTPQEPRMRVAEAATALRSGGDGRLSLREVDAPPAGVRSRLLETAIARELGVPAERVCAVWDARAAGVAAGIGQSVVLVGDRDVVVDSRSGGFTMRYGEGTQLDPRASVPAFVAAVHLADGHWRQVSRCDPWYASWRVRMVAAFLGGALLLAWPVWRMTRRLVEPIRRLGEAAAATRLAGDEPFPVEGPREIRAVADAMNAMHARLLGQARERNRILAAMAHDLRTPLTGLRVRAEAAPSLQRERMIADLDRMAGMIDDVLAYARLDGRAKVCEAVDVAASLRDCVAGRVALGQPVVLGEVPASCVVVGDGLLLRRAIENLLDNGVRYGESVRASLQVDADLARLRIDDRGPGLPAPELERASEPFWRFERSRSRATGGIGLGLTVVRDAAQAHGGTLSLSNLEIGGLRAELTLPIRGSTDLNGQPRSPFVGRRPE